ncbi:MAG: outer membrane beta-barrel protein [Thermoanaerobaculia bacterium]
MLRRPTLFALLLVSLPALAVAQGRGRFELTPTASYNFGGSINGQNNGFFDFDLETRESEAYGLTLDIPLAPWVQLELLASRQSTELEFDRGLFGGDRRFADIDISYYQVGGLFQWGNGQIHPYFVASLGVAELEPDVPGASSETRFAGSIGGGVKIFFNEHVGIRLEGRAFVTALDDYQTDDYCCYEFDCSCRYDDSQEFTQGQASAGLILAW